MEDSTLTLRTVSLRFGCEDNCEFCTGPETD